MKGGAWRFCWFCGKRFWSVRTANTFCSDRHQLRQWRAITMLEGTHGWVNDRWQRLPVEAAA